MDLTELFWAAWPACRRRAAAKKRGVCPICVPQKTRPQTIQQTKGLLRHAKSPQQNGRILQFFSWVLGAWKKPYLTQRKWRTSFHPVLFTVRIPAWKTNPFAKPRMARVCKEDPVMIFFALLRSPSSVTNSLFAMTLLASAPTCSNTGLITPVQLEINSPLQLDRFNTANKHEPIGILLPFLGHQKKRSLSSKVSSRNTSKTQGVATCQFRFRVYVPRMSPGLEGSASLLSHMKKMVRIFKCLSRTCCPDL